MEITFEFISGDYQGKKYTLTSDTVLVGRSKESDLTLSADMVSYQHCRFNLRADSFYLTDLGSTNGTFVNGSRHDSGFIKSTDKVMFGEGGPEAVVTYSVSGKAKPAAEKTRIAAVSDKKLILRVKDGLTYDFLPGTIRIGRGEDCDITLNHSLVSREHAEVIYDPPNVRIRDLHSTNGTFINGKKIESSNLSEGDVIMAGDKGPQIMVGTRGIGKSVFTGIFKVVIPFILALAVLAVAYKFIYQPWAQKRYLAKQTLTEYVAHRLDSLSAVLGDDSEEEIPLIFVESVVKYIESFTGRTRGWFERSLERSRDHMPMVRRLLRGAGLPEEFAYLAFIESGYMADITSSAGARGLWQFMPATAKGFGLRVEPGVVDERTDPRKSTEAACKYIKQLYNLYNSYMLAMASYNTGENRIARALRKIDVIEQNRFWYLVKSDLLHDETIGYVPKIMAAMIIATDPEKFGFQKQADGK